MRSALLAACALVVAAPAWAQEPLDPTDAATLRTMAEQLERMKIIRCDTEPGPMFYFFERQDDGSFRDLEIYAEESRAVVGERRVYLHEDNFTSLSDDRVIRVIGGSVEEAACIVVSEELASNLRYLLRPRD